ncbi:MAG TPA: phosphoribosyltransferase family protein [Chloroflexota bacterium]|nr:phosphoribosyltransferase family protein [Chloroflexota bacterium]
MARPRRRRDHSDVLFRDRVEAGVLLAHRVGEYRQSSPLVVGIATGGVVIAAEVARRLDADLDLLVVHRLPAPKLVDLTVGAVAASGHLVLANHLLQALDVSDADLRRLVATESARAQRHQEALRESAPAPSIAGRSVIVVDDGVATGLTMRAAIRSIRARQPASLMVAVPVGSRVACVALQAEVDELVCLHEPDPFLSVGLYYRTFDAVDDDEVRRIFRDLRNSRASAGSTASIPVAE